MIFILRLYVLFRFSSIPIFNVVCSETNLLTQEKVIQMLNKISKTFPLKPGLWYPNLSITTNRFKHYFLLIFTMWLPALLIDFLLLITFQTPFMIRVQKKVCASISVLEYFKTREWIFKQENSKQIQKNLSDEEKKNFNMNTEEIDQEEYFTNCFVGVSRFCLKQSPDTFPRNSKINH